MAQGMSTEAVSPAPGEGQNRQTVMVAIGALLLGMLLAALDQTIVSTALPTIASELGGLNHLSWVVTAYLLASTAATPCGASSVTSTAARSSSRPRSSSSSSAPRCAASPRTWRSSSASAHCRAWAAAASSCCPWRSSATSSPRANAESTRACSVRYSARPACSARCWAACSPNISAGAGSSTSTSRSASWRSSSSPPYCTPVRPTRHTIDYLGTFLIASVATCLVLVASLGGTTWAWGSAQIISLAVLSAVLLVAFVYVEQRATEPVLPLKLFRIRTFTLVAVISFIVGFAMFGAMTYLPTFLQVVQGVSPTLSGVHMLPMVLGMLIASTASGQIVSRTGRWKIFPIAGTGITAVGLFLLHQLDVSSSTWEMSTYFFVFGAGLGLVMQVLVLVVQNSVGYEDLGVATSGATFFRSIGASFGVSIFGTIFTSRLGDKLSEALAGQSVPSGPGPGQLAADPRAITELPPALRPSVLQAYASSITDVFLYAVPVVVLAFLVSWFLKEDKLRGSVTAPDPSETLASNPVERSSHEEVARALSVLGSREGRQRIYEKITAKAGYDMLPAASWLLLRIRRHGMVQPALLADTTPVPLRTITEAARQVEVRGLARREGLQLLLTDRGDEVAVRLAQAREESLAELLGDWWGPERPTDLVQLVRELTAELCGSDAERPYSRPPPGDHHAP